MGAKKLIPVICPRCENKIMSTGIQMMECGFDITCPYCGKWVHITGSKEKKKKKGGK